MRLIELIRGDIAQSFSSHTYGKQFFGNSEALQMSTESNRVFASTQHFSCIRMKVIYAERKLCISFADSFKVSAG